MKIYADVIGQLDSGGGHYSQELSEVDLSDPDDVKVLADNSEGEVLIHLGSSDYLDRYKIYVSHIREWRQQFDKLESVDLRYDRQIIVNPDLGGADEASAIVGIDCQSRDGRRCQAGSSGDAGPVAKVGQGRGSVAGKNER